MIKQFLFWVLIGCTVIPVATGAASVLLAAAVAIAVWWTP